MSRNPYAFGAHHKPPARTTTTTSLDEDAGGDDASRLHRAIVEAVASGTSHAAVIAALFDVLAGELAADGFDAVGALGAFSGSLALRVLDRQAGKEASGIIVDSSEVGSVIMMSTQAQLLGKTLGVIASAMGVPEITVRVGPVSERRAP